MDIWQGSECVSGSEYARVLNILGFWKWQGCTGFKMSLNNSWICLILPGHAWIFMNMPEYAGICVNLPTSSWMTCYLLSTLSISTKFIVWRNMRLFFQETKSDCNLGQNVRDKFTKSSKIGFSMECFTLIFCDFLPKSVKIWLLGGWLGTRHQIQAFRGFSWNILIS